MESLLVNLNTVGIKAKSKGELYRMLACEGTNVFHGAKEVRMGFISDVWLVRKKVLDLLIGLALFTCL